LRPNGLLSLPSFPRLHKRLGFPPLFVATPPPLSPFRREVSPRNPPGPLPTLRPFFPSDLCPLPYRKRPLFFDRAPMLFFTLCTPPALKKVSSIRTWKCPLLKFPSLGRFSSEEKCEFCSFFPGLSPLAFPPNRRPASYLFPSSRRFLFF